MTTFYIFYSTRKITVYHEEQKPKHAKNRLKIGHQELKKYIFFSFLTKEKVRKKVFNNCGRIRWDAVIANLKINIEIMFFLQNMFGSQSYQNFFYVKIVLLTFVTYTQTKQQNWIAKKYKDWLMFNLYICTLNIGGFGHAGLEHALH